MVTFGGETRQLAFESAAQFRIKPMPNGRGGRKMTPIDFHYRPTCSTIGCQRDAIYKVAASWSDGLSWELKNYGLACEDHRISQLARGKLHRDGLVLANGEVVGQVGLYVLETDARDATLSRLPDHGV